MLSAARAFTTTAESAPKPSDRQLAASLGCEPRRTRLTLSSDHGTTIADTHASAKEADSSAMADTGSTWVEKDTRAKRLNTYIHSFDQLPLKEGRTRTGMHVWHGRGAGLTSMAWDA